MTIPADSRQTSRTLVKKSAWHDGSNKAAKGAKRHDCFRGDIGIDETCAMGWALYQSQPTRWPNPKRRASDRSTLTNQGALPCHTPTAASLCA